jgi:hypothetical protein
VAKHDARQNDVGKASAAARKAQNAAGERVPQSKATLPKNSAADPVALGAGIEHDRDQLWAEAVARYKAGAKWWLETPELEALATAEQAMRFKVDTWKAPIEKWLRRRKSASIPEVLEHVPPADKTHSATIRVTSILTELGFTKRRLRKGHDRQYRYAREKS